MFVSVLLMLLKVLMQFVLLILHYLTAVSYLILHKINVGNAHVNPIADVVVQIIACVVHCLCEVCYHYIAFHAMVGQLYVLRN